ncbi:DUF975 family protein [Clostridium beijerinckii]|uniref:DUF975 family protein n=1 Tax=Clostridium beijerinckii TaxID=1520 RepID=UPI00156F4804|nr:DUF975 family protein [Clostridium beijerinckii]NRT73812.1 putative membrane protein [Clostridium beijerinckii]
MQITCGMIKEDARRSLKGKWTIAVLCTLLYGNFNIIFNFVPSKFHLNTLLWVLWVAASIVFSFGYNDVILQIIRDNKVEFLKFFSGYKMSLKALGMTILIWIYSVLWSILLFIPGIIARIKYSMAYYIWVDDPDISITEAIEKSIDITNGHKWEIFELYLSFIGWYLLLVIPFFAIIHYTGFSNIYSLTRNCELSIVSIGFLYLYTYVKASMAVLYNKLIEGRKLGLE